MGYLIDTNIVSESIKSEPSEKVRWWLEKHQSQNYLSSITIAELRLGIELLAHGKRRDRFENWMSNLCVEMEGRVLNFNSSTAHIWGQHMAAWQKKGVSIALMDSLIAAIAIQHRLILVTRNTSHFLKTGIRIINPFEI